MKRNNFKQGDIIKMNFAPTKGHEQTGYRPALVISSNSFNRMCGGIIKVLAITSNEKDFPLHIALPEGLPIYGKVLMEHERSIDENAIERKCKLICSVPEDFLDKILEVEKLTYKKAAK